MGSIFHSFTLFLVHLNLPVALLSRFLPVGTNESCARNNECLTCESRLAAIGPILRVDEVVWGGVFRKPTNQASSCCWTRNYTKLHTKIGRRKWSVPKNTKTQIVPATRLSTGTIHRSPPKTQNAYIAAFFPSNLISRHPTN